MVTKPRIRLYDKIFAHVDCVGNTFHASPAHFVWDRSSSGLRVGVYTDFSLDDVRTTSHEVKIGWLVESPSVFPGPYRDIVRYENDFAAIYTFHRGLLERGSKYRLYHLGGTWIQKPAIVDKSKLVSLVASKKRQTRGQLLRHDALALMDRADCFGRAVQDMRTKHPSLDPYRFQVVTENCQCDYYFTEKIIDCFLTGVVPIYWGCPSICELFNPNGIMRWDTIEELGRILRHLCVADYAERRDAILDNFERAKKYARTEDHLWECGLREMVA